MAQILFGHTNLTDFTDWCQCLKALAYPAGRVKSPADFTDDTDVCFGTRCSLIGFVRLSDAKDYLCGSVRSVGVFCCFHEGYSSF